MSEQLPNSIPNNFHLQEHPSGLIVAESRANHIYAEHPNFNIEPIKTRGMGYTETELGGKPFIVAERLQPGTSVTSKQPPEDYVPDWISDTVGAGNNSVPSGQKHKGPEHASMPKFKTIRYKPGKEGYTDFTVEFTNPGESINWSQIPEASEEGREILVTNASGRQFYFKNEELYDLQVSKQDGQLYAAPYKYDHALPPITIGQTWIASNSKKPNPDPVAKLEIVKDYFKQDDPELAHYPYDEERDVSPFDEADKIIEEIEELAKTAAENHPASPAHQAPAPGRTASAVPVEKFNPNQSFLSWSKEHRGPKLKELRRERKYGKYILGKLANFGDYAFSTYNSSPNLYNKLIDPTVTNNGSNPGGSGQPTPPQPTRVRTPGAAPLNNPATSPRPGTSPRIDLRDMTLVHNGQDEQPTVRVRIRPEQAGAVSSFGNISTDDAKKAALERMRVEMQERAEREDDEDEEAA